MTQDASERVSSAPESPEPVPCHRSGCSETFVPSRPWQKFCSKACQKRAYEDKHPRANIVREPKRPRRDRHRLGVEFQLHQPDVDLVDRVQEELELPDRSAALRHILDRFDDLEVIEAVAIKLARAEQAFEEESGCKLDDPVADALEELLPLIGD